MDQEPNFQIRDTTKRPPPLQGGPTGLLVTEIHRDKGLRPTNTVCCCFGQPLRATLLGPCSLEVSPEVLTSAVAFPTLRTSVHLLFLKLEQLCQAILNKDPLRIPCSPRAGTVSEGESGEGIEKLGRAELLVNTGHQQL